MIKVNEQDYLTIDTDNLNNEQAGRLGNEAFSVWSRSRPKRAVGPHNPGSVEEWAAFRSWLDGLKSRGGYSGQPPVEFVPVEPEPEPPEVVEEAPKPRRSMLHSRRAKK